MLTVAALHGQDGETAHADACMRVRTFGAREREHGVVVLGWHHGRWGRRSYCRAGVGSTVACFTLASTMVTPIGPTLAAAATQTQALSRRVSDVREMTEIAELAELSFSNFPSLIGPKWCGTDRSRIIWEVRHDATETLSISDST